jgi:phenylalanine-4-hydroxylase
VADEPIVSDTRERVPPHLRKFIVEQDYARYTEVDQAVWRFVLIHIRARLKDTAHPAYLDGLSATGIAADRIPSIAHMDACLSRFGWGAVCVDGFIPPRAFQEFQARGLLPIAADMRTRDHLVYTPAPDIIHEAAGHAPILPDLAYAAYLRRIGEIGEKAFTVPEESRVFQAIYTLSEVKGRCRIRGYPGIPCRHGFRTRRRGKVKPRWGYPYCCPELC